MELNPYVSGFIVAFLYLTTDHFLSKKIKGFRRVLITIAVPVAVMCLIYLIGDCIAG